MKAPKTTQSPNSLDTPAGGTTFKMAWNGYGVASLRSPAAGGAVLKIRKRHSIFQQATPADAVFYLLKGQVKLTAVSREGREATIAILQASDFLGEESLDSRERLRTTTAIALSECTVLKIERQAMLQNLERDPQLFRSFLSFLIARDVRMQEDLLDRLLHSSEQRLARVLLLLAGLNDSAQQEVTIPKVSQEILAEIVGTTRSRVSVFMNKFRQRGLIDYDGDYSGNLCIRSCLKNVLPKR